MQYPFTDEQLAVAEKTRSFMEREVAPVAAEMDARPDPADCYPRELINKASKEGLRTIAVPEAYGGMGVDTTTKAMALWTGALESFNRHRQVRHRGPEGKVAQDVR